MGRRCSECDAVLLADVWTQVTAPPCECMPLRPQVHSSVCNVLQMQLSPSRRLAHCRVARAQFSKGAVHKCLNCKRKGGFRKAINLSRERREEASHAR